MGWFIYNDENPINGQVSYVRGHTKGVLCFNKTSAFWLIHSAPKLVPQGKYSYPQNATDYAQTFLCITLKDADEARKITDQMFKGQQPNVCLASGVPAWLATGDSRASLIQNKITTNTAPYADFVIFNSKSGMFFKSIAKNMYWDTPGDDDFYNDLVGPALTENIEVETWEHTKDIPGRYQIDKVHTVLAMQAVDLQKLNIDPSFYWTEASDHAKLAVSDAGQQFSFVCVGDINFTISQEKRSGGTVAFVNNDLHDSLISILKDTVSRTSNDMALKFQNMLKFAEK
jgi:deoxyribonuclease-2